MERDIQAIRRDFPLLLQPLRNGRPVAYLDNAATSQKPRAVIGALQRFYENANANVHRAVHELAARATAAYEGARGTIAAFIGARDPRAVVFTRGTTEAVNLVAHAWALRNVRPGDLVIATAMEHHSNLVPWQEVCRRTGALLRLIEVTPEGELDEESWEHLTSQGTIRLLALTWASNVLGTVNPVRDWVCRAHTVGARVFVDAAQAAPHRPLEVDALDADFVAFSGHKMCGPTGIGVLFVHPRLWEEMDPFMTGGEMISRVHDDHAEWAEMPRKFEAGTPPIAGAVGLAAAVEYLSALGWDLIESRERELRDYARTRFAELDGVRTFGRAPERLAIVPFEVVGVHPHDVAQYLDQEGVAIRSGHLCAQPLLRRLGVEALNRASLYFYNTQEDIDRLVEATTRARKFFLS